MLRLAIQKSGRLYEGSVKFLEMCDINFKTSSSSLISKSSNFPIEILLLRDDDIPECVAQGVADIGIVGENTVLEKKKDVEIKRPLNFAKCRMSLALQKNIPYSDLSDLNNKRIATSYPSILGTYLKANNINAEIKEISGSVEISPNIGIADAIFDIVSTGNTLISNGLKEIIMVLESEAVLIASSNLNDQKNSVLNDLLFRVDSVLKAKPFRYILMNIPNNKIINVCKILPGMKSPTVMPLAEEGWSSIHTVVKQSDLWSVLIQLKNLGAEGILVAPIEKMLI